MMQKLNYASNFFMLAYMSMGIAKLNYFAQTIV